MMPNAKRARASRVRGGEGNSNLAIWRAYSDSVCEYIYIKIPRANDVARHNTLTSQRASAPAIRPLSQSFLEVLQFIG
jgi:hypothetical protein